MSMLLFVCTLFSKWIVLAKLSFSYLAFFYYTYLYYCEMCCVTVLNCVSKENIVDFK